MFTLGDYKNKKSETSTIFANLNPDVKPDHEEEEHEQAVDSDDDVKQEETDDTEADGKKTPVSQFPDGTSWSPE